MALLPARMAAGLDTALTAAAEIQFSTDGSTESIELRTPLTGTPKLKAATSANPSVKANNGALTSPGASAAKTITHFRYADSAHAALTTWVALTEPIPLLQNGTISVADGMCSEKLTQA